MDVRFRLGTVAQNTQGGWIVTETAQEIESNAMGLSGPDDVTETNARAVSPNIAQYEAISASPASFDAP